jgi:hypothetical protein
LTQNRLSTAPLMSTSTHSYLYHRRLNFADTSFATLEAMNGRDLTGVIFVVVILPLIVILAALCLWCNCYRKRGGRSRRSITSYAAETQLPYSNSPPWDPVYLPPYSRQSYSSRPRRHVPYKYASGPPWYPPQSHASNALHTPTMPQPNRQELREELYEGFNITPEMVRPQSPDSVYAGLDLTYEMLRGQQKREKLAQAGRPRRPPTPS